MRLRIQVTKDEIQSLIERAMPMRIHLSGPDGPERWVDLDSPREIELVPDVGLQMRCSGEFKFDVAKVPLQDDVRKIRVTLRPIIDTLDTGQATLAFDIDLDEADLATFPGFVDRGVANLVDAALTPERSKLRIPFQQLATRSSSVSPRVQPISAAKTRVEGSALAIAKDSILFSLDLSLELEREGTVGAHPPT